MNLRALLVFALCTSVACAKDVADDNGFGSGGSATASATAAGATGPSSDSSGAVDTGGTSASASSSGGQTGETPTGGADATSDTAVVSETDGGGDTSAGSAGEDTEADSDTVGQESSSEGSGDTAGTALDPELDVPDRGQSCTTPGSLGECPGSEVCRFYTAQEGRCESCDNCGNLNAPCSEGTDCDILFACFAGRCTNICPLGTSACGPVEDCLDIGHASYGVCDPFS